MSASVTMTTIRVKMNVECIAKSFFFFFNDTATTEIYTLSLHDALPISSIAPHGVIGAHRAFEVPSYFPEHLDRKSTRLNSSHDQISYAVFCLKKKKIQACSVPQNSEHWPM